RPTLLIDEADTFVRDNEEMRGILNSGHTKAAAHVIRNVEINGEHKPQRFSTWAPKALATIRELADTLEDRAIIVTLQRKPKEAAVSRLRKRDNDVSPRYCMTAPPTTGGPCWPSPILPAADGRSGRGTRHASCRARGTSRLRSTSRFWRT